MDRIARPSRARDDRDEGREVVEATADCRPRTSRAAVDGSLRRLRTDHIDLYYAHEDDPSVEQAEYVEAFDHLRRDGKVRMVGASNFTPERLHIGARGRARERPARVRGLAGSLEPRRARLRAHAASGDRARGLEGAAVLLARARAFSPASTVRERKVESVRAGRASKYLDNHKNVKLLHALDELAASHKVSVAGDLARVVEGARRRVARRSRARARWSNCMRCSSRAPCKLAPADVAKLSAITA